MGRSSLSMGHHTGSAPENVRTSKLPVFVRRQMYVFNSVRRTWNHGSGRQENIPHWMSRMNILRSHAHVVHCTTSGRSSQQVGKSRVKTIQNTQGVLLSRAIRRSRTPTIPGVATPKQWLSRPSKPQWLSRPCPLRFGRHTSSDRCFLRFRRGTTSCWHRDPGASSSSRKAEDVDVFAPVQVSWSRLQTDTEFSKFEQHGGVWLERHEHVHAMFSLCACSFRLLAEIEVSQARMLRARSFKNPPPRKSEKGVTLAVVLSFWEDGCM